MQVGVVLFEEAAHVQLPLTPTPAQLEQRQRLATSSLPRNPANKQQVRLQAAGGRVQAAGRRLQAAGERLQAAGERLQAAGGRLQAACKATSSR